MRFSHPRWKLPPLQSSRSGLPTPSGGDLPRQSGPSTHSDVGLSTWSEGIKPASPEHTATLQDDADSPQGPLPPPLFASRPIVTRLKSQQAPEGVGNEEVHGTPKELLDFYHLLR